MFEEKYSTERIKSKWGGTGTTDCSDAYYIKAQAKVTPTYQINKEDGETYPIAEMKNDLTKLLKKYLNNGPFSKKYILTIDLSETSPSYGKSSFLKIALYYSPNGESLGSKAMMKEIVDEMEKDINIIINKYKFIWTE